MLTAKAEGGKEIAARLRSIHRDMLTLGKLGLRVGIVGPGASQLEEGSSLTLAALGMLHEYGAPGANIPERSFLRSTLANRQIAIRGMWAEQLRLVIGRKKTPREALEHAGMALVAMIQQTIRDGIDPPLATETILRKGSTKPLIDHGQLINAISYEVVELPIARVAS
jgi:hypothetical protein